MLLHSIDFHDGWYNARLTTDLGAIYLRSPSLAEVKTLCLTLLNNHADDIPQQIRHLDQLCQPLHTRPHTSNDHLAQWGLRITPTPHGDHPYTLHVMGETYFHGTFPQCLRVALNRIENGHCVKTQAEPPTPDA